jgi:hypothetical protein
MIRIEVIGRWGEMGGVRRGDSVRIGHPKTIPHSHERIVANPRIEYAGTEPDHGKHRAFLVNLHP